MRLLGFVVVTFCVTAPASAQSAWFDLPVPTAALNRIDISLDEGRTLVAPRAIRVLHTIPREGELPTPLVEFEQLLTDLDAVEKESLRAGARGLRLEMAKNQSEREAGVAGRCEWGPRVVRREERRIDRVVREGR